MTDGQKVKEIKAYVEGVCNAFLAAHQDIEKVEYRSKGDNAYIKLTTAFGRSNYYDATGLDRNQICIMLCVIITGARVNTRLNDIETIRKVEKLFK